MSNKLKEKLQKIKIIRIKSNLFINQSIMNDLNSQVKLQNAHII